VNYSPDIKILFLTRGVRTFAYGSLAVIIALFLAARGFDDKGIGLLFTLTLVGDAVLSLGVSSIADRVGRKRLLVLSCALVVMAGLVFALTTSSVLLVLAAIIGTISPSGAEVGPFLSLEQAAIAQEVSSEDRTKVFAWYQVTGSLSNAFGALAVGWFAKSLQISGSTNLESYRAIILVYAALGVVLAVLFSRLTPKIEAPKRTGPQKTVGLHRSRVAVVRLSSLFALDSFGSGLVVQSLIAYWLHRRFNADVGALGGIFFFVNIFSGVSALASVRVAKRFGLINTMVWSHIPANILLILFPLMPTLETSVAILLARFLTSQMDVPARMSYTMAIVDADERSAASGFSNNAKLIGSSFGPLISGLIGLNAIPFILGGTLKIIYDLSLYRLFIAVKPPEEK
jgi:MFS family permease